METHVINEYIAGVGVIHINENRKKRGFPRFAGLLLRQYQILTP
jgi:hypothetical protein